MWENKIDVSAVKVVSELWQGAELRPIMPMVVWSTVRQQLALVRHKGTRGLLLPHVDAQTSPPEEYTCGYAATYLAGLLPAFVDKLAIEERRVVGIWGLLAETQPGGPTIHGFAENGAAAGPYILPLCMAVDGRAHIAGSWHPPDKAMLHAGAHVPPRMKAITKIIIERAIAHQAQNTHGDLQTAQPPSYSYPPQQRGNTHGQPQQLTS